MAPQVQAEIDSINKLLPPNIQIKDASSELELWAALFYLHSNYVAGPAPHETWKDAAIAEKIRNKS